MSSIVSNAKGTAVQEFRLPEAIFSEFQHIGKRAFDNQFENLKEKYLFAKDIYPDQGGASDCSVTSWEIADCVTIFASQTKPENPSKIDQISGYHFSFDGVSVEEIVEEYFEEFICDPNPNNIQIYIIGGNPMRTDETGSTFKDIIHEAIKQYFGTLDVIQQELYGEALTEMHGAYRHLHANLSTNADGKAELTYTIYHC